MKATGVQKKQANDLAALLYGQDDPCLSDQVKSLAAALGIGQLPGIENGETASYLTSDDRAPGDNGTLPGRIGIWNLATENGEEIYIRDQGARMDWWLWAKVHQFPARPAPGRKRVVLLGESVARGYLYDPFYTVAQELEAQLNRVAPGGLEAEVLDLARTDLSLPMLKNILAECVSLRPDAIVIFAGNNWLHTMKETFGPADYQQLCHLLDRGSLQEVGALLEGRFRELVTSFLEFAGGISLQSGVPVVFMIPEFNLDDWTSNPLEKNVTRLNNNGAAKWVSLVESGEEALLRKDFTALEDIAARMITLDITHPLGYEWKAACRKAAGDWPAARTMMEKARDTAIYGRAETKPRCLAVVRNTILEQAPANGITVVDLPAVFKDSCPDSLPGRHFFLDYCHLTVQGIKVAVRQTAATVAGVLLGREVAVVLDDSGLYPGDEAIAVAHVAAAVHNAHYGQPAPVLHYHCSRAAEVADLTRDFMRNFVDFSTRRLQTSLCKTHEEVVSSGVFTQYEGGLGFIHDRKKKLLDVALVDAMVAVASSPAEKLAEKMLLLRVAEHMPAADYDVNLLEACYATTSYDEFNLEIQERNYYQARSHRSDFTFVADGRSVFSATITGRIPGCTRGVQEVRILVNGRLLETVALQNQWRTISIQLPAGPLTREGVNTISLHWPAPEEHRPAAPASIQTPMEFLDFMYPVWGEIYAFDLRKAADDNGLFANNNAPGYTEALQASL
ncbi:hypothetical protein [Chitinophaga japonensis]|uniref:GDSL-like lipase/acylhydrolase family protein n=1 Tax=Chitinophaga japonensis TaxID=104662 RepID=A0A562SLE2_CHIJA|nr:hypothetical protein [Chitinophaga japonensis]TWI82111.1 hypothetical protein LX66_5429 [Chitinophaga japonensis]